MFDNNLRFKTFSPSQVAQFLLEQGADINVADLNGNKTIHFVKYVATAKLLIEAGADISDQSNVFGETPLYLAFKSVCLLSIISLVCG